MTFGAKVKKKRRDAGKTLYHKYFMLFLTHLVLRAAVSKNRAADNGRDTPESGRHREDFLRPFGGVHEIDVLVASVIDSECSF